MVKIWKKLFSFVAISALLINLLAPALQVYAQEVSTSPTPTVDVSQTPTPTDTPTPTITAEPTPTDTIAPSETPTATPTDSVTPTETPSPTPTLTDSITPTPTDTSTQQDSSVNSVPTQTPVPTPPSTSLPVNTVWTTNSDSVTTTNPVTLNVSYVAPQNSNVVVTFTKLPANPGKLTIKEITLTDAQVAQTGALSNKAYDITSDMANESFAYTLKLPVAQNNSQVSQDVKIKYAENLDSLVSSAQTVDQPKQQTSDSVTASDINHFTIFVVTSPDASALAGDACISAGAADGAHCYNSIQTAIDAASNGDTILVSGTVGSINAYTVYNVTKPIIIKGVNTGDVKAKVYGTFLIYVDGATIDNLSITNKGISHPNKNAINLLGKQVTITNNDFNLGNGTGGVANGVVIWPHGSNAVSLNITNNTFTGYSLTVTGWSSTALLIAEEINATPFTGTPLSTTIVVPNEKEFANGNTYINNNYDYVHQNWNGGSKWFYSKVSNSDGLLDAIANSAAGATILVAAGTYTEQLTVSKNLTLIGLGSGADPTIIQAPSELANDSDGAKTLVLFTGSITASISGFTIQGPVTGLNFGIYVRDGATANIHDNTIKDIRDESLSGNQYGVAIEVGKSADGTAPFVTQTGTATITNNTINGYQKTGIAVENTGSSATIAGNTITGAGPTTVTAQNGIQIRRGATGTVDGNTITNNAYDGPTYSAEGIGALHAGSGVIIQNNIVNHNSSNIYAWKSDGIQILNNQVSDSSSVDRNASAGITVESDGPSAFGGATGAYITGVTISGNTIQNNLSGTSILSDGIDLYDINGATISNNTVTGSSYDGIWIGKSGNIAFTGNNFSGNGLLVTDPNAAAIDFGGGSSLNPLGGFTVHNNSFSGDRNSIWNYDSGSVNATNNYWGSANPEFASIISSNVNHDPWWMDLAMTLPATLTTPDGAGSATIDSTSPQVVITNPTQPVDLTIDSGTTNPKIDLSLFISGGTGTIPQITITSTAGSGNAAAATIEIPATKVTGPADWNGVIAAPTVTNVTLPADSTLGTAIEIGFADAKLSFDNAVKIVLPGQAGKKVGYSRPGTPFTEITTTCGEDSQAWADANLGANGECKINVNSNLVIWTKHFTKFASYTQTSNNTSSGGSGVSDGLGCANHDCSGNKVGGGTSQGQTPVTSTALALAYVPGAELGVLGTTTLSTTPTPTPSNAPSEKTATKTGEVKAAAIKAPTPAQKQSNSNLLKILGIIAVILAAGGAAYLLKKNKLA